MKCGCLLSLLIINNWFNSIVDDHLACIISLKQYNTSKIFRCNRNTSNKDGLQSTINPCIFSSKLLRLNARINQNLSSAPLTSHYMNSKKYVPFVNCCLLQVFQTPDTALGTHQEVVKWNSINPVLKMPAKRSNINHNLESIKKKEDSYLLYQICWLKSQVQPKTKSLICIRPWCKMFRELNL